MSEDRLERALHEIKQEDVDAATLEATRVRVWDTMMNAAASGCAEFRPDFGAYLSGAVTGGRRVLLDDHISRCAACRTAARRDEGRPPGDRDAAAIVVALESMGPDRRRSGTGRVSPLCRTRHDRRLDGPRRTPSDGRVQRRRSVSPIRRCGRGRCRDRREGTHPHGPGHAGGIAPCRWIHCGCQRAHGAVRDRRVERAVHSSLARRRDREGGQAAPRPACAC